MRVPSVRPTLNFIFVVTLLGLALLLAALFALFYNGSRASIVASAGRMRDNAGAQIAARSEHYFQRALDSVDNIARQIQQRTITAKQPLDLEAPLYAELLGDPAITDLAFTYATRTGNTADGYAILAPDGRGEIVVLRSGSAPSQQIDTRHTHQAGAAFVTELRQRPANGDFASGKFEPEKPVAPVEDPTQADTFKTAASEDWFQKPIWSDLHPVPNSTTLPPQMCVSVQQSIVDANGKFLGVIRASLAVDELRHILAGGLNGMGQPDGHRIFLCDNAGRLIVPVMPDDKKVELKDAYRFESPHAPPEIAAALKAPQLANIDRQNVTEPIEFDVGDTHYLGTFRALNATQDWIVGIVAPERVYLQDLLEARREILKYALLVMAIILAGGILTIRLVKRDLATIVRETGRMRNFEFAPTRAEPLIDDVHVVMDRLEQAKTAMRSMSKYVPVALVRQLYEMRAEPQLGSELAEISLLFSDVKDFTTISEKLTPDTLAHALGRYLEVMTKAIQAQHGAVDKFIGDAVMALWNVPVPLNQHASAACQAALNCRRAIQELFASEAWKDLPHFETRFGLHKDRVMVGHFGAPDRLNYTAMGDGVNLASRLEGLNKLYGTSILVSDVIEAECRERFVFRLIDIVAVKGRAKGVKIYELLGTTGGTFALETFVTYEKAFERYQRREFSAALALLEPQLSDAPSAVLAERCRELQLRPPSREWTGIYIAKTK